MDYEEYPIPVLEADWRELRSPWFNASAAAALFGEHPQITLGDVCTEKLAGRKDPTSKQQEQFDRGHDWEDFVAHRVADLTGYTLLTPTVMYRRGPILANPDRLVKDRPDLVVELKTLRGEFLGPVLPRHWRWQVLAQMWACGASTGLVGALDGSLEVSLYEIERDNDAIKMMVDRAQAVVDALEWGEMPDGVELSASNVSRLWPKDTGDTVEVDPEVARWTAEYLGARDEAARWEKEKERLKSLVVSRIGSGSFAALNGYQFASYKAAKDGEVTDWRRMIAEHPEIAKLYTSTKPGARTFRPSVKALRSLQIPIPDNEVEEPW